MLGALIAQLDRPELAAEVLGTLGPDLAVAIEMRAVAASMTTTDFVAERSARLWTARTMIYGFRCSRSSARRMIRA